MLSYLVQVISLVALVPYMVSAFPQGTQSCLSGRQAVAQGAHASTRNSGGGRISSAGFKLYIDSHQVYEDTAFKFTAGVRHTIRLVATQDIMRGFLIRLADNAGADMGDALSTSDGDVQVAQYCQMINVGGLCHNSRSVKTEITGTLYVPQAGKSLDMDVTTVVSTVYSYGSSEWYVSNFILQSVAQGTSITYSGPSSGGSGSTTTACLATGQKCSAYGDCCTGVCTRSDSNAVFAPGYCTTGQSGVQSAPSFKSCFSSETSVEVKNKGTTKMKDLALDDEVLVAAGTFSKVYSFGHKHHSVEAEFLQLLPTGLEITGNHMVKVIERGFIPASHVVVGDHLETAIGEYVMVEEIAKVLRQGVYAPFTGAGTIVVSGIMASSYVVLQDSGYLIIGGYKTPISFQYLSHLSQAPHRVYSRMFGIGEETYTDEGVSLWVDLPQKLSEWYLNQHAIVMILLLIPAIAVFTFVSVVDAAISYVTWW